MPKKLHLKRTPEEEAQHRSHKKARKEERRKRKAYIDVEEDVPESSSQGRRRDSTSVNGNTNESGPSRKWASSDEEDNIFGPQPASSTHTFTKPDYDTIHAEIEELRFREKMFDALGDDERLDTVEAQMNDFAHVPDRWRTTATGSGSTGKRKFAYDDDELLKLDPRDMDDEEYVEWVRAGMYRLYFIIYSCTPYNDYRICRKTHAQEYAEQQQKKAAKAARRAEEKARKAEEARLESEAEENRKKRKAEKEWRHWEYAREEYRARWRALGIGAGGATEISIESELTFDDIPWPIANAHRSKASHSRTMTPRITVDELTKEAVATFLLPVHDQGGVEEVERRTKERRERLREAILRFHPDKFEGRFMRRVKETDQERVREAIGQVSRVLNSLMGG